MNIPNMTILINDIQRSMIEGRIFIQQAVVFYAKHLEQIGAVRNVILPKIEEKDSVNGDLLEMIIKRATYYNKEELTVIAGMKGIKFDPEITKEKILELIGGK